MTAVGTWTYSRAPSFRASALLVVQPAMDSGGSVSLQNTLSARERAATVVALGNTTEVQQVAGQTLGSNAGLRSCGFAQSGESEFLSATCSGASAAAVALRANAYASALETVLERERQARIDALMASYRDQVRILREQGAPASSYPAPPAYPSYRELETVETASPPRLPFAPQPVRTLAMAFVLGLIANTGLAFLLERLQNRARTLDHLRQSLELPVLAAIPRLSRVDTIVVYREEALNARAARADARSSA